MMLLQSRHISCCAAQDDWEISSGSQSPGPFAEEGEDDADLAADAD